MEPALADCCGVQYGESGQEYGDHRTTAVDTREVDCEEAEFVVGCSAEEEDILEEERQALFERQWAVQQMQEEVRAEVVGTKPISHSSSDAASSDS